MAGVKGMSGSGGSRPGAGRPKKAIDGRTTRTHYPTGVTGPRSLFRGKGGVPISVKLTAPHLESCARNAARLGVTRSDLIAWLIEQYADIAPKPA
jgi:hypothetical protein